jgi:hypothetical protein
MENTLAPRYFWHGITTIANIITYFTCGLAAFQEFARNLVHKTMERKVCEVLRETPVLHATLNCVACSPSVVQVSAGLRLLPSHGKQHCSHLWTGRHPHIAARARSDLLWLECCANGALPPTPPPPTGDKSSGCVGAGPGYKLSLWQTSRANSNFVCLEPSCREEECLLPGY